jgi:hypothetical protein
VPEKLSIKVRGALLNGEASPDQQRRVAKYIADVEAALIMAMSAREKRLAWMQARTDENRTALGIAEGHLDKIMRRNLAEIFHG